MGPANFANLIRIKDFNFKCSNKVLLIILVSKFLPVLKERRLLKKNVNAFLHSENMFFIIYPWIQLIIFTMIRY